jgi:pyruvate,water dikinase
MARHYIRWFEEIGIGDVASVGGKNASLGEMVRNLGPYGITVPPGFAITADAYRQLLAANNLEPLIAAKLAERKGGIFLAGLRWVKANGTNTPNLN